MVKVAIAAVLVAIGLSAMVAASWPAYAPEADAATAVEPEKPWFTYEALREIFDGERGFGPLFEGSTVGRSAPSPETRARIAAFAKQHGIAIDLQIEDDELRSVTLDITFGGCCGYEGVDVMAMGLGRPRYSECCNCKGTYIDNWALHTEDARIRVTVRVNRLTLHWEPRIALPVLLARMDALIGMRAETVKKSEGKHWKEADGRILLEQPYDFSGPNDWLGVAPGLAGRTDLGAEVRVEDGVIADIEFTLYPSVDTDEAIEAYQKLWGTPKLTDDDRTWTKRDRVITTNRERRLVKLTRARPAI